MPFVPLTGGYYQARSLIAGAQRCLNLFPEQIPTAQGEPFQYWDYCTPGLTWQQAAPQVICRGAYTASNGDLWLCYGQEILWYSNTGQWAIVGTLQPSQPSDAAPRTTPVTMVDNGTQILIADGSVDGWYANVITHDGFTRINTADPNYVGWLGADYLTFQDTFFVANQPGTPNWYISDSAAATFSNALAFASLTAQATNCVAPVSMHRNLWIIGSTSWEVWINSGGDGTAAGSFPFAIYPDATKNLGCVAVHSIATMDNAIYWLSQDKYGQGLILKATGIDTTTISTYAISFAISQYPTISDAIGYCYQQGKHLFYVLTFPSANDGRGATWCYDASENLWHERAYIDDNGIEYRHLGNACSAAYGQVFVGDWRNGNLYTFDLDNYTDDGQTIVRKRSFPHQIDLEANRRVMYSQLIANMQVGAATQTGPAQTIARVSFVDNTGTLLEDYYNLNDIGANFADLGSTEGVIINDALQAQSAGTVLYLVEDTPPSPDYIVSFNVTPAAGYASVAQDGSAIFAVGREVGADTGYIAQVSSDGTQYILTLSVQGTATSVSVSMGTLSAKFYTITMTLQSTSISVQAYREIDGMWLTPNSSWQGSPVNAIAIEDSTYTLPGAILIGGVWE